MRSSSIALPKRCGPAAQRHWIATTSTGSVMPFRVARRGSESRCCEPAATAARLARIVTGLEGVLRKQRQALRRRLGVRAQHVDDPEVQRAPARRAQRRRSVLAHLLVREAVVGG
jgi:hypothetical protein